LSAGFRKGRERRVHKGPIMELVVGEFFAPDGHPMQRDIVHHPGAVAVVPIVGDEAVLVRQYRPALDAELLEIPAGIRDVDGESLEATAARELAEEIGMRAATLEHLCAFHNAPGFSDELIHLFVGTGLTEVPRDAQGHEEEHMTIERVRLDDVPALVASGELTDAKSIIGLLLVLQRRATRPSSGHAASAGG
jgi:ADP-ribose pyrophosphatase